MIATAKFVHSEGPPGPDRDAEDDEFFRVMLIDVACVAADTIRSIQGDLGIPDDGWTPSANKAVGLSAALDRCARTMRRCIILARSLRHPPPASKAGLLPDLNPDHLPAAQPAAAAAAAEPIEPPETEPPETEPLDRLEAADEFPGDRGRPLRDLVDDIRHDLAQTQHDLDRDVRRRRLLPTDGAVHPSRWNQLPDYSLQKSVPVEGYDPLQHTPIDDLDVDNETIDDDTDENIDQNTGEAAEHPAGHPSCCGCAVRHPKNPGAG